MRISQLSEAESCNIKDISQGLHWRGKKNSRCCSYTKEFLCSEYFKDIFADTPICCYYWCYSNYDVTFLSPVDLSFSLKLCIFKKPSICYNMLNADENIKMEGSLNVSGT